MIAGGGAVFPSRFAEGSMGILFNAIPRGRDFDHVSIITEEGAEVRGKCVTSSAVYDETLETELRLTIDSFWEFPLVPDSTLKLRLYRGSEKWTEFTMRNPRRSYRNR
jgi:hypothetical protein